MPFLLRKSGTKPSKKTGPRHSKDPFAAREARKYARPAPSREYILERLEAIGAPAGYDSLRRHLQIDDPETAEGLRRRLIAMSRDGQLISTRRGDYGLPAHMDLVKGRVQGNKEGTGYLILERGGDDLYLGPRQMARLFDGDTVLARVSAARRRGEKTRRDDKKSRARKARNGDAHVVEVLQRRHREIVGRYYQEPGFGLIVPDNRRIGHEIIVPAEERGDAADGQYVVAQITQYPCHRHKATARVVEVLGDTGGASLAIQVALHSHNIPHEFPEAVVQAAAKLPTKVQGAELADQRRDLRQLPFVTIDGEDAKDFDDAVYARRETAGNYTLLVAIADVSHYVRPDSPLDQEARQRGTSVYFPGQVVPMLPPSLSDDLCSLRPHEDRLALVAEMTLAADGRVKDHCFYDAVICSQARLSYTEAADMVQEANNAAARRQRHRLRQHYGAIAPHLDALYEVYHLLAETRRQSGALDFETPETRIVFGAEHKVREIVPVTRNDAHRLIEECMLCANVCAARMLEKRRLPALYRVHEGPNPDKLDDLRAYLGGKGLHLGGGSQPAITDYAHLMQAVAGRSDRRLLHTMLIRSMMQAVYQPTNRGHFGLGFPAYTHFTSPIRRYPDLLVHRAIRHLLQEKKTKSSKLYPYGADELTALGEHCSATERRADAAGYQVQDWLKCQYMEDKVGEEYDGIITAVTGFGLFVELTDIHIEGLVHVTELRKDYYHFDPAHQVLQGERGGGSYRMGDNLRVKVVRVDLDERKIDLSILE